MSRQCSVQGGRALSLAIATLNLLASCAAPPTPTAETSTAQESGERCAPDITELNFSIISTESQSNQKVIFEPIIEVMSEQLGRPVNSFYATQYAGIVEAMGAGKVQIAWYGGKSYIEAAKLAEAEAFAQPVGLDGSKGYYSYLITNKDNPILNDIKRTPDASNPFIVKGEGDKYVVENAENLSFAFNDPNSTSGFLVPSYYVFAQQGANPNEIFDELIIAGSHEATALAVANNQVDVATNNSESLDRLRQTAPEELAQIEIIWTSPVIPSDPLAYRKDLPDCLKENIQDFFYNYRDEAVLEPLQTLRFEPATDADWNTIRQLEFAKQILEVENNDNLSEEAKQTQLEALNQQLEAVQ